VFYREADVILFLYDITNQKSFEELKKYWIHQVLNVSEKLLMWVVGTKYDMIDNDEVSLVKREEIEEFAKEFNLHISYTSSKDNIGITVKYNTNNTINLIKIINLIN